MGFSVSESVRTVMALATAVLSLVMSPCARAGTLPRGYVADIRMEREQKTEELVWIQKPSEDKALRDRIFNDRLSREFRERYEQRFGQTEIERVFLAPNRTSYYNDVYGMKGNATRYFE